MASTQKTPLTPLAHHPRQSLLSASIIIAVLLVLVLVLLRRRKSLSRGGAVLLLGAPDAGKTAILTTLAYDRTHLTHTSIQTNSSIISLGPSASMRIVDIPGHPRIRDQFTEYLGQAKGIVFVVDAGSVSRNGAAVAEHLHHVLHALTSLPPSQHVPSLLVLAHKSDLLKSSSSTAITRVRTILARELTRRRHAQVSGAGTTAGLEALGEEGEGKGELGGLECAGEKLEFDWDNWEGGEVTFAGTWVKVAAEAEARENGLQELREWMQLL